MSEAGEGLGEQLGKKPVRVERLEKALATRQPTLTVVIENIHDPHNFNAILRSCDAVGVMEVHTIYTVEKPPRLAHTSSSGAYKWIEVRPHESVEACFAHLHDKGFHIIGTRLDPTARELYDFDLTRPTAIVLGNEHRGISEDVQRLADDLLYIPMMGMAESVNVSVANAVCLFEALRQRRLAGMYANPQLSPEAYRSKLKEWLLR